jgi:hypothetical protein
MAWCGYGLEVQYLQLHYLLYCPLPTTQFMLRFVPKYFIICSPPEKKHLSLLVCEKEMIVNIPLPRYDAKRRGVDNQFDVLESKLTLATNSSP